MWWKITIQFSWCWYYIDTGRPPFSSPITQYRLRCECGARTECEMITIEISLRWNFEIYSICPLAPYRGISLQLWMCWCVRLPCALFIISWGFATVVVGVRSLFLPLLCFRPISSVSIKTFISIFIIAWINTSNNDFAYALWSVGCLVSSSLAWIVLLFWMAVYVFVMHSVLRK